MTSALDINSPRGRVAAEMQHRAAEIVFGNSPDHSFIHTPDDDAAAVDGCIVKLNTIVGVAEIKSRDSTYENMMGPFKGEWLLSYQKLLDIQSVSRLMRLPGFGMVFLIPSEIVLVLPLTSKEGEIVCKHRTERTQTQATVNGGTANRLNAFIQVSGAKIYQ